MEEKKVYKYLLHVVYHTTNVSRSHTGELLVLGHPINYQDILDYKRKLGDEHANVVGFSKFEE